MIRVISSPSISTTGVFTLILAILAPLMRITAADHRTAAPCGGKPRARVAQNHLERHGTMRQISGYDPARIPRWPGRVPPQSAGARRGAKTPLRASLGLVGVSTHWTPCPTNPLPGPGLPEAHPHRPAQRGAYPQLPRHACQHHAVPRPQRGFRDGLRNRLRPRAWACRIFAYTANGGRLRHTGPAAHQRLMRAATTTAWRSRISAWRRT